MPIELERFVEFPTENDIAAIVTRILEFLKIKTMNIPMAYTEDEIRKSIAVKSLEISFKYALENSLKGGVDRRYIDGVWYYGLKSLYGKWPAKYGED